MTPDTAVRQAWMTAGEYLRNAVREIDEQFGDGYAAKNPALVGVFMQVAAQDFAAWVESTKGRAGEG